MIARAIFLDMVNDGADERRDEIERHFQSSGMIYAALDQHCSEELVAVLCRYSRDARMTFLSS